MKNSNAIIIENSRIAKDVFEMKLQVPQDGLQASKAAEEIIKPGQFINIRLDGKFLRRPISICDWSENEITIIYKVVGSGTEQMSRMKAGGELDILWPLGNGFCIIPDKKPILLGGGAGVPPMYGLCKRLLAEGQKPAVIMGFRSAEDVFYQERFEALGVQTVVATEDGSAGMQGFVTDALAQLTGQQGASEESRSETIYACGPEAMLRAIDKTAPQEIPGQFSFEERMGCGFGACMGCSCKTKYGNKRICKDGPVLERSEIIW